MLAAYAFHGDKRRAALDEIQNKIDAEQSELADLCARPRTLDECRALLSHVLGGHSSLALRARGMLTARDLSMVDRIDAREPLTLNDLEWLFGREALLGLMTTALAPVLESKAEPVTDATFATKTEQINLRLQELHAAEEAEVLRLYDLGIKAVRRENVDPATIFNIWQGVQDHDEQ